MKVHVYLGPSLAVERAKCVPLRPDINLKVFPPCRMGDVYKSVEQGADVIALIDGYFESTPAVWHKEILYALAKGVQVFGGASMGALRAAEMHRFGMRGVGEVYAMFTSGEIEDDDEVAVSHLSSAEDYTALSVAMVNIRHGLSLARSEGIISIEIHDRLIEMAKRTYYPMRTWSELVRQGKEAGICDQDLRRLDDFIRERDPDLKRSDAVATLQAAFESVDLLENQWPMNRLVSFEPTIFWEHLTSYFSEAPESDSGTLQRQKFIDHVNFNTPQDSHLRDKALLIVMAQDLVKHLPVKRRSASHTMKMFRYRRGLASAAEFKNWLTENNVTKSECLYLAEVEDRLFQISQVYRERTNPMLEHASKICGNYKDLVSNCIEKLSFLSDRGVSTPVKDDVDSVDEVLNWYRTTVRDIHSPTIEEHINELGFSSVNHFLGELLAEYLYRTNGKAV